MCFKIKTCVLRLTFQQTQGNGISAMLLQGQGPNVVTKLYNLNSNWL